MTQKCCTLARIVHHNTVSTTTAIAYTARELLEENHDPK